MSDEERLREQRDHWIRLYVRLEGAVNHHQRDKSELFVDEIDEALYAARDRVVRDSLTY